jgi:predicted DNA-binding WGR domain protein
MHIYMQHIAADKKSPCFYHLMLQKDLLEGWTLIREWGIQGSPGRVKRDYYLTWGAALAALACIRNTQLRRGFQVVFTQGEEYKRDYE